MKAIILARGLGTRMKAADPNASLSAAEAAMASTGIKALVPLADERPFMDFVLSALADAGCTSICLVIGPGPQPLRDRYTEVAPPRRFRIAFAEQAEPRGTGDAVLAAEAFVGADEFLMVNSDNYYPKTVLRTLVEMGQPGSVFFTPEGLAAHSNIELERIRMFALGRIGADGCLDALIEKPDEAAIAALGTPRHVSMNCWRFPPAIFDACRGLVPSVRGELELADAITRAIGAGLRLRILKSDDGVLDLSRRGDIAEVRERLRDVEVAL